MLAKLYKAKSVTTQMLFGSKLEIVTEVHSEGIPDTLIFLYTLFSLLRLHEYVSWYLSGLYIGGFHEMFTKSMPLVAGSISIISDVAVIRTRFKSRQFNPCH